MIRYILECVAFQLVFLIVYDFFLKRETFFQWNRAYLLGTYLLSLLLPWVKIEALKTTVPADYYLYPEYLWDLETAPVEISAAESPILDLSWQEGVLLLGMLVATLMFGYKIFQLYRLRKKGKIHFFSTFTRIIVSNSSLAFSFFKSIFIGDKIVETERENIIQHELVHIRQRHSWDLLFFEIMRIAMWFNPLVYVYQNRISELHEFIADAHVAKNNKKEQYELLLNQVFQTQRISFVNQFFNSSLIKKRIVMLQKSSSKKIWQLKYLLLLPIVLGMLFYTSSEAQEKEETAQEQTLDDTSLITKMNEEIDKEIVEWGSLKALFFNSSVMRNHSNPEVIPSKEEYFKVQILIKLHYKAMIADLIERKGKEEDLLKMNDRIMSTPSPSSARYDRYVARKRAFQLLDENLKWSIGAFKSDVHLIDRTGNYPDEHYVFEVVDVTDLTGMELKAFNNKLDEIFEKEDSGYKAIILTDKQYACEIRTIIIGGAAKTIDYSKSSNDSVTAKYNELEAERKKLLKISNDKNPIIVNLDKQLQGLKRQMQINKDMIVPFAIVEEVPVFPGCEGKNDLRECFKKMLQQHISKHFRYPEEAQNQGIQGMVNIMFTIDQNGDITNIRKKGPNSLLEDEAHRIISLLPQMKSGKQKGQTVNVPFAIPISFKLRKDVEKSLENNSSRDFNLVPSNIPGTNKKLKEMVTRYNQLAIERKRLIMKSGKKNPIVVNIDNQLQLLINQIYASGLYGAIPLINVDEAPVFPGCEDASELRYCFVEKFERHVSKNFYYPEEAQKKGIQGDVSLHFTITKNGDVAQASAIGPDEILEDVVLDIIKKLPKMEPAIHNGQKAPVIYFHKITFKL